ncbi:hypothetical protein I4U23_028646 [Adineta vaga]|nr:hypothetical protein I4U23_028646 [Adineta vaga]
MTHTDINSRARIVHLVVTHGSDQYDIHFHMDRPPLVRDLMEQLQGKSHVTMVNQQVFYRGQRLHDSPNKPLDQFGIFNGNQIHLVGEKLTGSHEEHFRHLLSTEKDVKALDVLLGRICSELENLKQRQPPRDQCEQYLENLYARSEHCRSNLQAFQSQIMNINVSPSESESYRTKNELNSLIRDRLDIVSNVLYTISSYQGGHTGYRLPTNDDYLFHKH